jgi:hypothetical protein
MQIKFKDGSLYSVKTPVEQFAVKNGTTLWALGFTFYGEFSSENILSILSDNNISEITIIDDDAPEKETIITGYSSIQNLVIRHTSAQTAMAEVQLVKEV